MGIFSKKEKQEPSYEIVPKDRIIDVTTYGDRTWVTYLDKQIEKQRIDCAITYSDIPESYLKAYDDRSVAVSTLWIPLSKLL